MRRVIKRGKKANGKVKGKEVQEEDKGMGDDDDLLFSRNIDDGQEWLGTNRHEDGGVGREQDSREQGNIDDLAYCLWDEDLVLREEEFQTYDDEDEDTAIRQPVYSRAQRNSPSFALGMIFANKKEFKELVDDQAIIEGRSVYFSKSDKNRSYVRCSQEDCEWRVNLRKRPSDGSFEITTFYADHTCVKEYNVKNMISNWLSDRYGYQFSCEKKRNVEGFKKAIIKEVRSHVTWWQAYRCKRLAFKGQDGCGAEQYGLLWNYANEIETMPPFDDVVFANRSNFMYMILSTLD
ncbi:hypothetical protein OROMI_015896 [Orobanche minor]